MITYVSLCPECVDGCSTDHNHCPSVILPNVLHYTITTQPSTHCLNGFGDMLVGGNSSWIAPNPSDFGTMTPCKCNNPGPGCCTNMGMTVGFFCETGGPPYWRVSFAFGGCNFASITCDLNLSLTATTVISCSPFHVQFSFVYNNVTCTGGQTGCTFNLDVTL